MSVVVVIFLGLIADAGVMLYFGWGLIDAVIAGSLFTYIAVTGLAGFTIATLVALIAAAALHDTHAIFRETRYRQRDPIPRSGPVRIHKGPRPTQRLSGPPPSKIVSLSRL